MFRTLLTLNLLALVPTAYAGGFAAIAVSPSYTKLGASNHAETLEDASDEAKRDCGVRDCFVATYTQNGCVAAAFSYLTPRHLQWFGFANDKTLKAAQQEALRICEFNAREYCVLAKSFCTTDSDEDDNGSNDNNNNDNNNNDRN